MIPSSAVIASSKRRNAVASAARGSRTRSRRSSGPAGSSGTPNSRFSPSAAPRNSATSVDIAMISACTHMPQVNARGKCARIASGQVAVGDDPELGRQVLDQHRHQVRAAARPTAAGSRTARRPGCWWRSCRGRRRRSRRRTPGRASPASRARDPWRAAARARSGSRALGLAERDRGAARRRPRAPDAARRGGGVTARLRLELDPHRAARARRRSPCSRSPKRTNTGPPNGWRPMTSRRSPSAMPCSAR